MCPDIVHAQRTVFGVLICVLCKCINCENEDLRFENVDTEEVEQTGINDVELPSREDENDS